MLRADRKRELNCSLVLKLSVSEKKKLESVGGEGIGDSKSSSAVLVFFFFFQISNLIFPQQFGNKYERILPHVRALLQWAGKAPMMPSSGSCGKRKAFSRFMGNLDKDCKSHSFFLPSIWWHMWHTYVSIRNEAECPADVNCRIDGKPRVSAYNLEAKELGGNLPYEKIFSSVVSGFHG